MRRKATLWVITFLGMLLSQAALAIEFDEVRNYEDVFVISGSAPARNKLEIRWKIADGYFLYNNKFLRFETTSDGVVLGEAEVPRGEIKFDELLGEEVEKYHGELIVTLPLDSVAAGVEAVKLKVRSQGCLENVLCYPPTEQLLIVSLPRESPQANPLAGLNETAQPQAGAGERDSLST